jgi:hypothetical protein
MSQKLTCHRKKLDFINITYLMNHCAMENVKECLHPILVALDLRYYDDIARLSYMTDPNT